MRLTTIRDLDHLSKTLAARKRHELPAAGLGRAAVLVGLYGPGPDYHVLYTVRTSRVEHHKGQISFPGGRCDPGDTGIVHTALRETHEEIGIQHHHVTVLGLLDDIITSSQFTVTPVLAQIKEHPYDFKLQEIEVETLLTVPLSHLADPANRLLMDEGKEVRPGASYRFGQHVIWGATARMTTHFLDILNAVKA